jgi:hypothetical protein
MHTHVAGRLPSLPALSDQDPLAQVPPKYCHLFLILLVLPYLSPMQGILNQEQATPRYLTPWAYLVRKTGAQRENKFCPWWRSTQDPSTVVQYQQTHAPTGADFDSPHTSPELCWWTSSYSSSHGAQDVVLHTTTPSRCHAHANQMLRSWSCNLGSVCGRAIVWLVFR